MARKTTRLQRPFVASPDQVRILRQPDGQSAVIEYADERVMSTHFTIGPELASLTDREILDRHNEVLQAQALLAAGYEHVAVEVPAGRPQITYEERADQWVPRAASCES